MAEENIDRNRNIVKAVATMFADAAGQIPDDTEPALVYSLSLPTEEPGEGAEAR